MAAFPQFGSDLDMATQKLLNRGARLTELLKQDQFAPFKVEEQVVVIYAGVNGYLDKIEIGDIGRYERDLLTLMQGKEKALLDMIANEKALSNEIEAKLKPIVENFTEHFV